MTASGSAATCCAGLHEAPTGRRSRLRGPWSSAWLLLLALIAALALHRPAAAADFLEPEQAFQLSARFTAPDALEVIVKIAPGYYVYRESLKFSAEGAALGEPSIPPGKVKYDENFQKNVETYRTELRIPVPVQPGGGPFTLLATSQGCADAGLCYPPMTTRFAMAPGSTAAVLPTPEAAAGAAPGSALGAALGTAGGQASGMPTDEAGWVDAALSSGRSWQVIGVFLGLGLLLSLTPCVLPMLPILSSLIVGAGAQAAGRGRGLMLAAVYSLGMALVYTALGVAAGLAGEGLAAALQTPWAIGAFAAVIVLLALSMFDVYELRLPASLTTRLNDQSNRLPAGQVAGVFLMGGISALMVSPCVSAPLAGALLFISQTGDAVTGGTALFSMAAGMSVPLLLLGASAGQWLPKAGGWMVAVKRLFGLIMLAVAIWLARPVLPAGLQVALWGALALLAAWLLKPWQGGGAAGPGGALLRRALGGLMLAAGGLQLASAATGGRDALQPWAHWTHPQGQATAEALAFRVIHSPAELDQALAAARGRTVVLDFYADWCVSCKEMERFTFRDAAVAARLQQAVLLKADVTANSESERALLRRFKLFGPPGLLFFGPDGQEIRGTRVIGFVEARRFEGTLDSAGL